MMLYKEHVVQYKESNNVLEKEKEYLLDYKASSHQLYSRCTIENISKAMLHLNLKEVEIKTLKENLAERDTKITSLKEIMTKKDTLISEV